jgi:pimeloyl-ACP methyl ester carboxylesterase
MSDRCSGWAPKRLTPPALVRSRRERHAFTPTLTGLGEREHLRASDATLSDHIDDVVAVIEFERLDDVVLCGQNYGGMVVTGVADRAAVRIRLLAYLDAIRLTGQVDRLPRAYVRCTAGDDERRPHHHDAEAPIRRLR